MSTSDERWVNAVIQSLKLGKFYGSVTLKFENGRIVLVQKNETFKPPTLTNK